MPQALDPAVYRDLVRRALEEDVAGGDVTTNAIIPESARGRGVFLAKADCVVAGLDIAYETFRQVDPRLIAVRTREDGDRCGASTRTSCAGCPACTANGGIRAGPQRTGAAYRRRQAALRPRAMV